MADMDWMVYGIGTPVFTQTRVQPWVREATGENIFNIIVIRRWKLSANPLIMLSRKARFNSHGQDSSYFLGWEEYQKNPYHHLHNPSGIIQMGLAENQASTLYITLLL
ncbi:hypothetical protein CsSME_00014055 [Camellia sinensis var. sinensis]